MGKPAVQAATPAVAHLNQFAKPTPELAQNLAIVLQALDTRSPIPDYAGGPVEPDPRSPAGGKGYTGLEGVLQYVFNITNAISYYRTVRPPARGRPVRQPNLQPVRDPADDRQQSGLVQGRPEHHQPAQLLRVAGAQPARRQRARPVQPARVRARPGRLPGPGLRDDLLRAEDERLQAPGVELAQLVPADRPGRAQKAGTGSVRYGPDARVSRGRGRLELGLERIAAQRQPDGRSDRLAADGQPAASVSTPAAPRRRPETTPRRRRPRPVAAAAPAGRPSNSSTTSCRHETRTATRVRESGADRGGHGAGRDRGGVPRVQREQRAAVRADPPAQGRHRQRLLAGPGQRRRGGRLPDRARLGHAADRARQRDRRGAAGAAAEHQPTGGCRSTRRRRSGRARCWA